MRLIGLAVVLAVGLSLAPLVAEAQQAGKLYRIGSLVPGTAAALLHGYHRGVSLKAFAFRKQERPPFGLVTVNIAPGSRVLFVDDVAGLGLTFVRCVERARSHGLVPVAALALIDRGDGARERVRSLDVEFVSLVSLSELLGRDDGEGEERDGWSEGDGARG